MTIQAKVRTTTLVSSGRITTMISSPCSQFGERVMTKASG
jgi:hypothetical protein